MDLELIREKYAKEQTVLETEIRSLEAEEANLRKLAGISETATIDEILNESAKLKLELEEKEKEINSILAQLDKEEREIKEAIS